MARPDRKDAVAAAKPANIEDLRGELTKAIKAHWRFDRSLHDRLARKKPADLSYEDAFKLHTQQVLKDLRSSSGQEDLARVQKEYRWAPEKKERTLVLRRLQERESPFGPRPGAVWVGGGERPEDNADFEGWILNTALTHLGSMEAVALSPEGTVGEVQLVPLQDVMQVVFIDPPQRTEFRQALFFWEDEGRQAAHFVVPMNYGTTWLSPLPFEEEIKESRFIRPYPVEALKAGMGAGLGRQQLTLRSFPGEMGSGELFEVGELYFPLYPEDPEFEARCLRRGQDPDQIRAALDQG